LLPNSIGEQTIDFSAIELRLCGQDTGQVCRQSGCNQKLGKESSESHFSLLSTRKAVANIYDPLFRVLTLGCVRSQKSPKEKISEASGGEAQSSPSPGSANRKSTTHTTQRHRRPGVLSKTSNKIRNETFEVQLDAWAATLHSNKSGENSPEGRSTAGTAH
jgi:hypothetical protein